MPSSLKALSMNVESDGLRRINLMWWYHASNARDFKSSKVSYFLFRRAYMWSRLKEYLDWHWSAACPFEAIKMGLSPKCNPTAFEDYQHSLQKNHQSTLAVASHFLLHHREYYTGKHTIATITCNNTVQVISKPFLRLMTHPVELHLILYSRH
jgi:hypothetical protein